MVKTKAPKIEKRAKPAAENAAVDKPLEETRPEASKKYRELYEREQIHAHELTLLHEMTRAVLMTRDLDLVLNELAVNMAKLLNADDCYITRWDEEKQQVIPETTTAKLDVPYQSEIVEAHQVSITSSVIKVGHALAAEDVFNSPYVDAEIAKRYPPRSILGVPLIFRGHKLGAAIIAFNLPHPFTPEEIERAEQAASHVALAIWNARQDREIKKRLKEQETLAKIISTLSQTERVGLANVLDLIVHSARELIPEAQQAVIHLMDKEKAYLIPEAVSGIEKADGAKGKMRLGEGIAGLVFSEGNSMYIPSIEEDVRFISLKPSVKYRSLLVSPILSGSHKLGTISIQSDKSYAFSDNDLNLMDELGQQAAIAIESAMLIESTGQALRETSALYHINQGLVALDANELLKDAVQLLQNNFNYYHVQVFVVDPASGNFILKAASGEVGKRLVELKHEVRAGAGIVGYAAETGNPFFTNNVDEVVFFLYDPNLPETKAEMAIPVRNEEKLYGVLDIQQTADKPFTIRDQQLVTTIADQLAVALHKAELYENLQTALNQEKSIRNQLIQNERLAVMGRLLASVSHELNNPLQAIQNALFLLKEERGMSQQGLNDLEIVIAESERMAGLIERLRDTYRPPQAEDLQPTPINAIIEDVFALVSTHLRKNEVAFEFHPDLEMPTIMALPDQVRQVALNLVMNAVEAMSNGGKLTVNTKYLRETKEVLLSVSDTGTGISPSILPLIFDPFVTDKKRGTGIGLTISHDIVIKHRGRITAENNQGPGATFNVWLPVNSAPMEVE